MQTISSRLADQLVEEILMPGDDPTAARDLIMLVESVADPTGDPRRYSLSRDIINSAFRFTDAHRKALRDYSEEIEVRAAEMEEELERDQAAAR